MAPAPVPEPAKMGQPLSLKNHYFLQNLKKLLKPGAALIYASSGSIPIFKSASAPAPAPVEKIKWLRLQLRLRPNHATPAPQT